jgi:hypothetical protein
MATAKTIQDNRKGQFDLYEDMKWFAVCENHGMYVGFTTKREAQQVKTSEFCADCEGAN